MSDYDTDTSDSYEDRIEQLQSKLAAAEEREKGLRELLEEALPNIECKNGNQSGLITTIGEYLQALKEKP